MQELAAGDLDRRITFQRRLPSQEGTYGTSNGAWKNFASDIAAKVEDILPTRSESTSDDLAMQTGRAWVWIRYRTDISSDMRVIYRGRVMQIVSGPAEYGRLKWLRMLCEEYSTAGDAP